MSFHRGINPYVNQVELFVSEIERSRAFYTEELGFKVLTEEGKSITLTADGVNPLITLVENQEAAPKQARRTGLFHFAILLPSRKDLSNFIIHMQEKRYLLQGAADHLFSEALYLADPDGHGIEVYRDLPPEEWTWQGEELPLVSDPIDMEGVIQAGDGHWNGLPSDTVIGHIHLHVRNLEEAKRFYVDGLGFDVTIPMRHRALFVSTGGYHHHIGLNTWNGTDIPKPDQGSVHMRWYSIKFHDEAQRNERVEQLNRMGYSVETEGDLIWTEDPSGNRILLDAK
ncbi:VOC family protein [Pseudalkalibacillus sp. Hm43]|uniref:VOC family protein n=1 Tax=Pseudalkalibacillus sp. Hm43 TaxID=3450742 RepID=UPI003F421E2D